MMDMCDNPDCGSIAVKKVKLVNSHDQVIDRAKVCAYCVDVIDSDHSGTVHVTDR